MFFHFRWARRGCTCPRPTRTLGARATKQSTRRRARLPSSGAGPLQYSLSSNLPSSLLFSTHYPSYCGSHVNLRVTREAELDVHAGTQHASCPDRGLLDQTCASNNSVISFHLEGMWCAHRSFQCMRACSSLCTAFFDAYPTAAPALAAAPAGDGDFAYLLGNVRSHAAPIGGQGKQQQQQQQQQQRRKTGQERQI